MQPDPGVPPDYAGGSVILQDIHRNRDPRLFTAEKAADQSVTNSTTLVDVTGLDVPIAIGQDTFIQWNILCDADAAADLKFAVTIPTGASRWWGHHLDAVTATSGTDAYPANGVGTILKCIIWCYVKGGTAAGDATLQFAQNAAHASAATIRIYSSVIAHRV